MQGGRKIKKSAHIRSTIMTVIERLNYPPLAGLVYTGNM